MRYLGLTVLFVLMASIVLGATATVTGVNNPPTEFATIRDAVEWLKTNYANVPNVVDVTTDGPITETAIIDISTNCEADFTINGDADGNGTPCTVITDAAAPGSQGNFLMPFSSNYAQLFIGGSNATYTIQDLIFQPIFIAEDSPLDETEKPGGVRGIVLDQLPTATGPFTIYLNNIIVGGSKAGNVLAADPNVNEWALCTRYFRNNSWSGVNPPTNSVHLTNVQVFNLNSEGWIFDSEYTDVDINEGCIVAWTGQAGLWIRSNVDSTLTIDGTADSRNLIRGSGQDGPSALGLQVEGPDLDTQAFQWLTLTYTDVIENGGENELGRHLGPSLMDNCFIALNDMRNDDATGADTGNIRIGSGNTTASGPSGTRTISNCTFYNSLNPAGEQRNLNFPGAFDNFTFNLSNVIIAGVSDIGFHLNAGTNNILNLDGCALVTAGPNALGQKYSPDPPSWTVNETAVINSDPRFHSTYYTCGDTESYLRVGTADYQTAGPGGGELTGAGSSIEILPLPTCSRNWVLYE